ncbi:transposase [Desulfarculales bacterium]
MVWDEKNQKQVVFLTNHHKLTASIVADIYKDRWKIELLLKALKQNLKVKTFVGTSSNALEIQIWTALIVLRLLKWLHHLSLAAWSLSNLTAMLRLNLFTYRELRAWLQHSYHTPSCPSRSSYCSCPDLDRQPPVKQKTSAQKRRPYLKNC